MSGRDLHGFLISNTFTIKMLRENVNSLDDDKRKLGTIYVDDISKRILFLRIGLYRFTGYDDRVIATNDDKVLNELAATALVQNLNGQTAPATSAQFVINDRLKILSRILKIINEEINYKMTVVEQELINMEKSRSNSSSQNITIIGNKNKVNSQSDTTNNYTFKFYFVFILTIAFVFLIYKIFS